MKKFGYIIIGLIMGLVLGLSSSAFGSEIGSKVDSLVTVKLNGEKIGTGVVIGGTSYLPVRVTASSLGADVSYEKGEVLLSKEPPKILKPEGMTDAERSRYDYVKGRIVYVTNRINELEGYLVNVNERISEFDNRVKTYRGYVEQGGSTYEPLVIQFEKQIEELKKNESEYRAELESLKKELAELEAEKAELESKQTASE
jgi:hypothetical protein